jgi:hypothetical protein
MTTYAIKQSLISCIASHVPNVELSRKHQHLEFVLFPLKVSEQQQKKMPYDEL